MMNQLLTNITRFSENQVTFNTGDNNNMTTLSYLIPVGKIIQDKITGKFSFIDIFDTFTIPPNLNFLYQSFFIAGKISDIKAGKHKIDISIVDPEEKEFATIHFPERDVVHGDVPLTAFFNIVKFEKIGRYHIKAFVDDEELKGHSKFYFDVKKGVLNDIPGK